MSYQSIFVTTNIEYLRKKQVITYNTCDHLGVSSALGALSCRFESCRSDSKKPSYTRELPRLAFLLQKYDHSKCGQIVVNLYISIMKLLIVLNKRGLIIF